MLTLRDRQTAPLFDPWNNLGAKRRKLLDKCWAGVFREHLLDHLPVSRLRQRFNAMFGRPSKDLHVVMGALVLQQLHDMTDAAAVESVSFNIAWHYALDIHNQADAYICERTLRTYRRWVIDEGLDEELFKQLTDQLIQAFAINTAQQRIDSTAVQSAMRVMTRLGIVVSTISKFLRELARQHPALYAEVDEAIVERFRNRMGDGCFAFGKPSESQKQLIEVVQTLNGLVIRFRDTAAATLNSFQLLTRVFDEQCEPVDSGEGKVTIMPKAPSTIPSDTVQNPSDPEASFNTHRGTGYLAQVMETFTEKASPDEKATVPDLITHIAVNKMTAHDAQALEPALNDVAKRNIPIDVLLGDSHYGPSEYVDQAAERGVEIVAPIMPPKGYKRGRLALEEFELNESGAVKRCPEGFSPEKVSVGKNKIEVQFDQKFCESCEYRERCPGYAKSAGRQTSRWQYTPERVAHYHRRRFERTDAFKQRYRWRAGVEATMSRLKYQMGLAALRVRGRAAVNYAVFLRALGLNIRRVAAFAT